MEEKELQTILLQSPLYPKLYRKNDWWDEMIPEELGVDEAVEFKDEILTLIEKQHQRDEGDRGLAAYLDEGLDEKVYSIHPSVEEIDGKLWGMTEVKTFGPLSHGEYNELLGELEGQFCDGWGEGLEQRPINTPQGELYISFGGSNGTYFINCSEELEGPDGPEYGNSGFGPAYRDSRHFSEVFRKMVGVSPSEYRRGDS